MEGREPAQEGLLLGRDEAEGDGPSGELVVGGDGLGGGAAAHPDGERGEAEELAGGLEEGDVFEAPLHLHPLGAGLGGEVARVAVEGLVEERQDDEGALAAAGGGLGELLEEEDLVDAGGAAGGVLEGLAELVDHEKDADPAARVHEGGEVFEEPDEARMEVGGLRAARTDGAGLVEERPLRLAGAEESAKRAVDRVEEGREERAVRPTDEDGAEPAGAVGELADLRFERAVDRVELAQRRRRRRLGHRRQELREEHHERRFPHAVGPGERPRAGCRSGVGPLDDAREEPRAEGGERVALGGVGAVGVGDDLHRAEEAPPHLEELREGRHAALPRPERSAWVSHACGSTRFFRRSCRRPAVSS